MSYTSCERCGEPLYESDHPFSGRIVFCNNGACDRDGGKPLPPSMLPRRHRASRERAMRRAFKGIAR